MQFTPQYRMQKIRLAIIVQNEENYLLTVAQARTPIPDLQGQQRLLSRSGI